MTHLTTKEMQELNNMELRQLRNDVHNKKVVNEEYLEVILAELRNRSEKQKEKIVQLMNQIFNQNHL